MAKRKNEREAELWERVAETCHEVPIGLCIGVTRNVEAGDMRFTMWRRIDGYMKPGDAWAYKTDSWGQCRPADRGARCMAALWLAEDARNGVPVIEVAP